MGSVNEKTGRIRTQLKVTLLIYWFRHLCHPFLWTLLFHLPGYGVLSANLPSSSPLKRQIQSSESHSNEMMRGVKKCQCRMCCLPQAGRYIVSVSKIKFGLRAEQRKITKSNVFFVYFLSPNQFSVVLVVLLLSQQQRQYHIYTTLY